MEDKRNINVFEDAIKDKNREIAFYGVMGVSKLKDISMDWLSLERLLVSEDRGLVQATILTLATHRVESSKEKIIAFLNSSVADLRFAAATALINYKYDGSLDAIEKILTLPYENHGLKYNQKQIESLKLNALNAMQKNKWVRLENVLTELADNDSMQRVRLKSQELLNLLKN